MAKREAGFKEQRHANQQVLILADSVISRVCAYLYQEAACMDRWKQML